MTKTLRDRIIRLLLIHSSTTLSLGACLTGCAGVNFYSDAALTKRIGIPVYAPKPYLLVTRTDDKEKPTAVNIVYLNDTERVIYAQPRSGFGTAKMSMSFSNGQLTTYGQETDPKIAELLTSFGGLITARAGAAKTEAEADKIRRESTQQSALSMLEVGKSLSAIAVDISTKKQQGALKPLSQAELKTVDSAAQAVSTAAGVLIDAAKRIMWPQQLDLVKAQADALDALPRADGTSPRDLSLNLVHSWAKQIRQLIVQPSTAQGEQFQPVEQPSFELYEIIQSSNGTSLLRIRP